MPVHPEMVHLGCSNLVGLPQGQKDTRYGPAFTFLATTGTRRGEALGTRWRDVDLKQGHVSIRQTVNLVDKQIVISQRTKTAKAHVITLTEQP